MSDYLSCADTAKLIRIALRDAFPGVRFSVRSKTYAGGASITVGYTDGPDVLDVRRVVDGFSGKDFDGMIDMGIYVASVLDADGRVVGRQGPGTVGSGGVLPALDDPIPPGGRVVHFGADYVFVDQTLSPAMSSAADAILRRRGYDPDKPWTMPAGARHDAVRDALRWARDFDAIVNGI